MGKVVLDGFPPLLLPAATFVSSINNRVTVAGVALEADDLGAPGAPGVRASSLVLDGFPLFSPPPPALG